MTNILLTGGAGFIGSHLMEHIKEKYRDTNIFVVDNLSTGSHNVKLLKSLGVELIIGNIEQKDTIDDIPNNLDCIYHLAAMNRAPRSIKDPLKSNEVNISGTLLILELARKNDCPLIFSSSSSVFGHLEIMPRPENSSDFLPSHPYGLGKMASEHYCRIYNELYNVDTRIIRYFAVYGPRQSPKLTYSAVIPKFIKAAITGDPVKIFGGQQSRNFAFVKDVVEATFILGDSQKVKHRTFNIGGQEEITINKLVDILEDITGKKIERSYEDYNIGDIFRSVPEMKNLKEEFDYKPKHSFTEGLKIMYKWYLENSDYFS